MSKLTIDRYPIRLVLDFVKDGEAAFEWLKTEQHKAHEARLPSARHLGIALTAVRMQWEADIERIRDEGGLLLIGAVGV